MNELCLSLSLSLSVMPQVNVACPSTGAQKQIKVDEDSKVSEAACARDQRTRERHKSWDLFFFFFPAR